MILSAVRRVPSAAIRLLLWTLFAGVVYFSAYRYVADKPFEDFIVGPALTAINQGHPFSYIFPYESFSIAFGNPARLDTVPKRDPGLPIALSMLSVVKASLTGDGTLTDATVYHLVLLLLLATGAVVLLPGVPLPVASAAILTLGISVVFGIVAFGYPKSWVPTYMAILAGTLVATTLTARRFRWQLVFAACIGLISGSMLLVRQDSVLTLYAALACLLVLGGGYAGFRFWRSQGAERAFYGAMAKRIVLSVGIVAAAYYSVSLLARGVLSLAWHIPLAETGVPVHGAGLPAYLGLGYVSNPYNIAWLDDNGRVHQELITNQHDFRNDPYEAILFREWTRLVMEDPALVVRNVAAKLPVVWKSVYRQQTAGPWQPGFVTMLARLPDPVFFLFIPALVGSLIAVIVRRRAEGWIVWLSFIGVSGSALVSPLLVHPTYIDALRGVLVAVTFILPAAIIALPTSPARAMRWRPVAYAVPAIALIALMIGLWINGASARLQDQVVNFAPAEAPVQLQTQQFRFGYLFNRLPVEAQAQAIDALLASPDLVRFMPSADEQSSHFDVAAVIATDDQLHLIVHLNPTDPDHSPNPAFGIGAQLYWTLCSGCTMSSVILNPIMRNTDDYPPNETQFPINDLFWGEPQYRMFSMMADAPLRNTDELLLGLQHITGAGPDGLFGNAFTLETLDTERLTREAGA